ncbi:MAG: FAD-linked oxidase C-terminal domain-containing protein [Candidatus Velthaea sp.]
MAPTFASRLLEALGPDVVYTQPEDLAAYAYDAYIEDRLPGAAIVPRDAREAAIAIRIARACGEAVVPRGAGTGLCGGAVPQRGGLVISFARMNRVLELDVRNQRARVQPGLINLDLSKAIAAHGIFYAPDPSSQKISTIGGNVGTNAGGAHCLSYGTTTNHILGLQYIDAQGEIQRTSLDDAGYDLTGLLVGSEGTLGVVTEIDVRLMKLPEAVRVCVAAFADIESASEAVSAIIGAGIVPTALEIMDRLITEAVEAHYHAGYPAGAGAVLLVEVAGAHDDMDASESTIAKIARDHGALSWRAARDAAERDALWAARKGAAGAIGRIAPNYYIQDACVPRSKLPQVMTQIDRIARDHRLPVGNVFHAGDGNLHPLLIFDRRDKRQVQAVVDAGHEILSTCIAMGGTISGEHGIGSEKRESLSLVFTPDDLGAMSRVRDVFDPARGFNPDKIFPSGAVCGEVTAAASAA